MTTQIWLMVPVAVVVAAIIGDWCVTATEDTIKELTRRMWQ